MSDVELPARFCPSCTRVSVPRAAVADLVICGTCGSTLKVDKVTGHARAAKAVDVAGLSDAEVQILKHARGELARRSPGDK